MDYLSVNNHTTYRKPKHTLSCQEEPTHSISVPSEHWLKWEKFIYTNQFDIET